jgi:hypothetical protein
MKIIFKNKTLGATGIIAAALFFVSGIALARLDMSFFQNMSLRLPDEQMGRTVPFVIKGVTFYLTSLQAGLAKGLTWTTFATLGVFAAAFWACEQAAKRER